MINMALLIFIPGKEERERESEKGRFSYFDLHIFAPQK